MALEELEGNTLGDKHRKYNSIRQELISTKRSVTDIKTDDSDVSNLLKIDVACHNRDVDYILSVLKDEDMLYISKALARSTWLVTDQKYANIINPDYLRTELFPNMTSKAICKLKKHIRHHIKDETRAEQFYLQEENRAEAVKWLPYCSVDFIENNVEKFFVPKDFQNPLKLRLFRRLCEKSITAFEIILKNISFYEQQKYLEAATFLLKTDVDRYLNVLESESTSNRNVMFNDKATDLIMKHSAKRIIDNVEKYIAHIHIPTFVKYLKVEEIKPFLYTQAKRDLRDSQLSSLKKLFYYDTLKHFVERLPKTEQYDFVRNVCMHKNEGLDNKENLETDAEVYEMNNRICEQREQNYIWYKFAPFEIAFEKLTKLIADSANSQDKRAILSVLIKCADQNLEYIQMILKHFMNKHKNEELSYKLQFLTEILFDTRISKYDSKTWDVFNELLSNMKIYDASSVYTAIDAEIINSIIVCSVLNDQKPPEQIEKMFSFNTLKKYKQDLNTEQQNKIFTYLYERTLPKLNIPVTEEKIFPVLIELLEDVLKLIRDWEKPLEEYPIILDKIRELIKLKKERGWKQSLSTLYNFNKSWRRIMFEDSVSLHPSEEVYLNVLKHDPDVLARHPDEVNALRSDSTISLPRLLTKLRTYWPKSLAQQWTDEYINNIKEPNGQKAVIRSLCTVLPQKPLLNIIEQYKPVQPKIDWNEIDDSVLNVQRLLAKNMHRSRPQPSPDTILLYAKGDYLQSALPSLLAILYNMKSTMNGEYIPKLLDAPVSLQKHGIRFAFKRLDRQELKTIFLNCWQTSKNVSIRAIIFQFTFKLLCNEKDPAMAISLWELLELFVDNLSFTEDKDIYELLSKVEKVPLNVRSKFLVKSYTFLQKLIPTLEESKRSHYKWLAAQVAQLSREVMETISPAFVTTIIQEFIDEDFFNCEYKFGSAVHPSDGMVPVISAYLLCSTNENDQLQKYNNVLVPLMRRSFEKWGQKRDGKLFVKQHFQCLLTCLLEDLSAYVVKKNMIIPVKMYSLILSELEKNLSVQENYILLTKWKLTVTLTELVNKYSCTNEDWNEQLGLEFGNICLEHLKSDVLKYFPCIYVLFSTTLKEILDEIKPKNATLQFYEGMLSDKDCIQAYLSCIEIGLHHRKDEEYQKIWTQIFSHPSVEVKMHYYDKIEEKAF